MKTQKDFQSAFNVVVKYGFCGDCRWKLESENCRECGCYESVKLIKESLEKQIPKKVDIFEWMPARCPNCGTELSEHCGDGYYKHCKHLQVCPNVDCCQRLDWGE